MILHWLPDAIKDVNHTNAMKIIESWTDLLSCSLQILSHRTIWSYLSDSGTRLSIIKKNVTPMNIYVSYYGSI